MSILSQTGIHHTPKLPSQKPPTNLVTSFEKKKMADAEQVRPQARRTGTSQVWTFELTQTAYLRDYEHLPNNPPTLTGWGPGTGLGLTRAP